ncbi:MAG TPA: hypothetical protein DD417_18260 [Elusimicrobia bacterium]|nr:hypothetical protein [Elusimicrobiota bacterium]
MDSETSGKGLIFIVVLFFFGTAAWALWVLMGEQTASDEAASLPRAESVFDGERDSSEIQSRLAEERAGAPSAIPSPTAMTPIAKDGMESGSFGAPGGREAEPAPAAARREEPPPSPDEGQGLLSRAVKDWSPAKAQEVGVQKGMLTTLAKALMKHPKVVRALFDNEIVVKGFMSRGKVKANCESADSLRSYLTDRGNSGVLNEKVALVKSFLQEPASAKAFAGSRFAKALTGCPSAKTLMSDPTSLTPIVSSNPGLMAILTDPGLMSSLAANPEAASLFKTGTASLGGGSR